MLGDLFGGGGSDIPAFDVEAAITKSAQVNRLNQTTPFGSLTYSGPYRRNLNFELSPELQNLLDLQTGFGGQSVALGQGMLSAVPMSGDAATEAIMGRLNPQLAMREEQLRSRLENSGNPAAFGGELAEGSFNELSLFNQSANDARLAAILAGPQYQGQLLNNALTAGAGSPISVPQYNFQGAAPINVEGLFNTQYQGQLAQAQIDQQRSSGLLGGLASLGSAAMLGPLAGGFAAGGAGAGGLTGAQWGAFGF